MLRASRQASAGAGKPLARGRGRGAEKGRGHVAARLVGGRLGPRSRRVTVKARLVVHAQAAPGSTAAHLRYIQRDSVTRDGERGQAYSADRDIADVDAFEARVEPDRHEFRFIVSPEDAAEIGDLSGYTRELMGRMEADLGTRLDWVAVDHWDTDNPHTHVVLRGVDETGANLVIARDYIAHGMRGRASELATDLLGPQTEREMRERMTREVGQERWTGLDRQLAEQARDRKVDLRVVPADSDGRFRRGLLVGRLQELERLGLAEAAGPGRWTLSADAEPTLRAMGERGDIIRTMQRALGGADRPLAVFDVTVPAPARIVGRIAAKGLADELQDRGYLVVDGLDGRAHYVALPSGADLSAYPTGGIVEVSGGPREPRPPIARSRRAWARTASTDPTSIWPRLAATPDPATIRTAMSAPTSVGSRRFAGPAWSSAWATAPGACRRLPRSSRGVRGRAVGRRGRRAALASRCRTAGAGARRDLA